MSAGRYRNPLVPAQAGTQLLDFRLRGNERRNVPSDAGGFPSPLWEG
jgi:hypothetical protein